MNPHVTTAVLAEQVGQYRAALDAGGHPPPTELPLMREAWLAESEAHPVAHSVKS